jgi:hypothetical protein
VYFSVLPGLGNSLACCCDCARPRVGKANDAVATALERIRVRRSIGDSFAVILAFQVKEVNSR